MPKGLIFTYMMTYGGALASLLDPFYGLLAYVCFAIIRPESLWYWSVPPGNYSRIVGVALLVGWAGHGFGDWRLGRSRGVLAALLGFLGWSFVGYLFAPDKDVAWVFFESLAKIVLPFVVGLTMIDAVWKLRALCWVIVVSQGYVAFELYQTYLGGYNRLQDQGFGFMDNNCYAIGLVAATGLSFFVGLGETRWWTRMVAWGATLFSANAVFLSFSRGGMLALIITGFTAFCLIPKRPGSYLVMFLALAVGARLAGPQVQERFATILSSEEGKDAQGGGRLDLWRACLQEMSSSPILGIGPDHMPLVMERYGFPHGKSAHSLWLQLGAELGLTGLLLLLSFYGLCAKALWPMRQESYPVYDPWIRDVARMVITALIGFAVAAQFVTLYGLEMPYYICLIGAGALKLNAQAVPLRANTTLAAPVQHQPAVIHGGWPS